MTASLESIPKDLRNLRACLLCSMIKTFEQFEFDGCDNCDEYLHMKNNRDMVYDCTKDSWVAKWQRINRKAKGIYAISVSGRLPPATVRELKSRGITYKSRDTSTV
ncbi:transcription elongation factor SPT4-A [Ixodes scapularis]